MTYSPPTLIGAGPPANGGYQQGLQPMTLIGLALLEVALVGGNRSLVARTSKCGRTYSMSLVEIEIYSNIGIVLHIPHIVI